MTDFVEDYYVYPLLIDLATCVCEEITSSGLDPVGFCGVLPGGAAALEGCNMAWTRLASAYPSSAFPVPDVLLLSCVPPLAFQIEVGIVRCYTPHTDGSPLSVAEQLTLTRLVTADMAAMLRAIRCCMGKFDDLGDDLEYVLGQYSPIPQQGGAVGGLWTLSVTQGTRRRV